MPKKIKITHCFSAFAHHITVVSDRQTLRDLLGLSDPWKDIEVLTSSGEILPASVLHGYICFIGNEDEIELPDETPAMPPVQTNQEGLKEVTVSLDG